MSEDQEPAGTPPEAEHTPPAPRRTRGGLVIIGPTVRSRCLPGVLIGLPLLCLLLCPLAAAGIDQWADARAAAGRTVPLSALLHDPWGQLLAGWLGLWALLALWALLPMLLAHRTALLDEEAGTLRLRRGLRTGAPEPVAAVVYAVGEAERGYDALIGLGAPTAPEELAARRWRIPHIGWDDASFDGLRALQAAAGLRPAPPRAVLAAQARRRRRESAHREMAERIGMPWRPEYAHDEAAFQRDFDHARRVLGGKEPGGS